jgi:hypothetical protein
MFKVFISHSSKDKPFVKKLKEDLNFNDIETWVDQDELKVGDHLSESLMRGIGESTHFIIVLSNNIKGSDWVQLELDEAITSFDNKILQKIIPVLLRDTDIPKQLNNLLRADFTKITFSLKDDKAHSVGDDYTKELGKIINAIKFNKGVQLSETEKKSLIKDSNPTGELKKQTKVNAFYEIAGYISAESKRKKIQDLKSKHKGTPLNKIAVESVVPIVLPNLLKPLFDDLKLGDKIFFPTDPTENLEGHFCGFSLNNSRMLIPSAIRKPFGIKSGDIVFLEVDGVERKIKFID